MRQILYRTKNKMQILTTLTETTIIRHNVQREPIFYYNGFRCEHTKAQGGECRLGKSFELGGRGVWKEKMTMISQDEIVSNAKTVTKGLEALRQEHQAILGGIRTSLGAVDLGPEGENSLITEKCALMERSLEMIELGLGEAHVMAALATHLQATEAEKQKLRSQVA